MATIGRKVKVNAPEQKDGQGRVLVGGGDHNRVGSIVHWFYMGATGERKVDEANATLPLLAVLLDGDESPVTFRPEQLLFDDGTPVPPGPEPGDKVVR